MINNNLNKDINRIKKYLINDFYSNPKSTYSISSISKHTNIDKSTVKLVINMLKAKKLISLKNSKFKINLETIEYLENNLRTIQNQKLTGLALYFACGSLILEVIINAYNISLFFQFCLLIFIIYAYSYTKNL